MTAWIPVLVGIIGIISTWMAWKFNPKRLMYEELDRIFSTWEKLNVQRDEALEKNDTDTLTIVVSELNKLRERKTEILQRLGSN